MHDLESICLYRMSCLADKMVGVFKPGNGCNEVQAKLSFPPPVHSTRLAKADMKQMCFYPIWVSPALTPNSLKFYLLFQKIICWAALWTGVQLKQTAKTSYFLHH